MSDQPELFPEPPPEVRSERTYVFGGHARRTDPATSHQGARDVAPRAGSQKALLLQTYRYAGTRGLTDEEACTTTRGVGTGGWKRCSDLRRDGLIEPTGEERVGSSGSMQMVCRVVTDGG